MNINLTPEEVARFHARFAPASSGCRVWKGEKNGNGYGRFTIWRKGRRIRLLSHRVAFALTQELRDGQVLRHSCDNPPCGNPEHLTPGTQTDNVRDAMKRGRLVTDGLTVYRQQRDAAARARRTAGRKTCSRCRVEKSFDGFCANRSNCDGRQYECKECQANRRRAARGGMSQNERRALGRSDKAGQVAA
ncbi:hypothetical protein E1258_27645 [Micromonospora sp. KC207]|uniref:hypothetical protein n=1 Tax=Micromonospora sp. KC207 TaxID=2530377 RepID=UPI00104CB500|nr:hypothetical protein [Micromonospora sp. KC207]TDC48850.1 hypothetical protein E1258_27645 [Micromonospora sp. KC207]